MEVIFNDCQICGCGSFNTKSFLSHLDTNHKNLSDKTKKREYDIFSNRLWYLRTKDEREVKTFLSKIVPILRPYLTKDSISTLKTKLKLSDIYSFINIKLDSSTRNKLYLDGHDFIIPVEDNYFNLWYYNSFVFKTPMY